MCRSIEPRRDDLAGGVDHVERGVGRDVVVDGGDTAARHGDVEPALVAAARIDDLAAADQQVEPHRHLERGANHVERLEPEEPVVVEVHAGERRACGRASSFAARLSTLVAVGR